MDRQQLLMQVAEYFGEDEVEPSDDLEDQLESYLFGFFHGMDPSSINEFFREVKFGAQIATRLVEANSVLQQGGELDPESPVPITERVAVTTTKKLLRNIKCLLQELGSDIFKPPWWDQETSGQSLANAFDQTSFVANKFTGEFEQSKTTRDFWELLIPVTNLIRNSDAAAAVMYGAVESMFSERIVTYYTLWPIVASRFDVKDPFKPAFKLWASGVHLQFVDCRSVEIWIPLRLDVDSKDGFCPPGLLDSAPLDYEWEGIHSATVFVSSCAVDEIVKWFLAQFSDGNSAKVGHESSGTVLKLNDPCEAEIRIADVHDAKKRASFHQFIESSKLKKLEMEHSPNSIGVILVST